MRESERIERISDLFKKLWKLQPDMRFMQLVYYLINTYNDEQNDKFQKTVYEKEEWNDITSFRKMTIVDAFYLEDNEFDKFLEDELEIQMKNSNQN